MANGCRMKRNSMKNIKDNLQRCADAIHKNQLNYINAKRKKDKRKYVENINEFQKQKKR